MAPPSQESFGDAQIPDGVHGVPLQSASDLQSLLHCMASSSGPKPTGQGLIQVVPLQETPGSPSAVLQGFCPLFMMQSTGGSGHPARGAPATALGEVGVVDGGAETTALGALVGLDDAVDEADLGLGSGAVLSSSLAAFFEEQPRSELHVSTITSARSMART